MTEPTGAVFISYASQDAEPAQRIADALRAAGTEVWFDQSELRGGDVWDQRIRRQIRDCALFVPIISAQTEARIEGYFRREWNLAVDRMMDIADGHALILPVVIDTTRHDDAKVPARFRTVQWTKLEGGQVSVAFIAHLRRLLEGRGSPPRGLGSKRGGVTAAPTDDAAERRQVTVLFASLAASAMRATPSDPEDVREVVAAFRQCVADIVGRYDGHVAQCFCEGILVYFGHPRAHEDDPERAIRAGLESIERVAALDPGGTRCQARVAIATGLVIVGDRRDSDSAPRGGIVGEAPGLVMRLLESAEPDAVIIAESTRRLLGDLFELTDLGPVVLKGIEAPVRAWKVLGVGSAEGRFDAFHAARLTALVGREEEADLLARRWATAAAGEGQVVLLSGEAGIGKSRLAAALMQRLADASFVRVRYFCSPQHSASALHPFITELERSAGIRHDDAAKARIDKLSSLLAQLPTSARAARLFASMLSLAADGQDSTPDPTPEQQRHQTLEAIVARIEALTAHNPALIVFEDAHWIDPTSLEVLSLIVYRIMKLRALLVITFRPEFEAPWTGESHVTTLNLHRLTERQSGALVDRIAEDKPLSDQARRNIIERTDGIPLFVEEMTKALLEAQGEKPERNAETAVPVTLHASLMARLDRLGTAKHVAQIGAALGRDFPYSLLVVIAGMPDTDLDLALERLVRSSLLFARGVHPYRHYIFKHALVQDAAYGTLLREPRRALHARIAAVLESHFADLVGRQPELLASHCAEAGQIEKAAAFWGKAGQQSLARSALLEAKEQLTRAIEQIRRLPDTAALRREHIRFEVALLNALFHLKGYAAPETKAAAERARLLIETSRALGEGSEDPLPYLSVLYGFWVANLVAFDSAVCVHLATRFLSFADEQQATGPQVVGHQILGISVLSVGYLADARTHFDRALSLYDPAEHRALAMHFGQDSRVVVLARRSSALWMLGYPDAALADAEQALNDARQIGHAVTLMYALSHVGFALNQCGRYERAIAVLQEGSALAEDKRAMYWKSFAMLNLACVDALAGRAPEAIASMIEGLEARAATGTTMWNSLYFSYLARAQAEIGKFDQARISIENALSNIVKTNERWGEAEVRRIAGEIEMLVPAKNHSAAELHFTLALEVARSQQAKSWELRAGTSLAKLWLDQGRHAAARDLLAPLYGWFTEGKDTLDLKRAKALLDGLP